LRLLEDKVGKIWDDYHLNGEWKGKSAGGSTNFPTWHDNPQYGISVKTPDTRIFINLSQPDTRMNWSTTYQTAIGLHIMKTKEISVPKVNCSVEEVVAKIPYTPSRDVSIAATLQPGNYVIIPSTYQPKQEEKFWLVVYTEEKVECKHILPDCETYIQGEWKGPTAGGSFNHPTWPNNPKYLLSPVKGIPPAPIQISVLLRQPDTPTFFYMSMYIGKYVEGMKWDKFLLRGSKACVNSREICHEITVEPNNWPLYIIPHTFKDNQQTQFDLMTHSPVPLNLQPLNS